MQRTELTQQLSGLVEERGALARFLRHAAGELEAGRTVDEDAVRNRFLGYRTRFEMLATHVGLDVDATIAQIEERIQMAAIVEPAAEIVSRLSRLRVNRGQSSSAVDLVRSESQQLATRLRQAVVADRADMDTAKELLDGRHPLTLLEKLVGNPDEMDDATWETSVERVRESFGNELATALLRNRLTLESEAVDRIGRGMAWDDESDDAVISAKSTN